VTVEALQQSWRRVSDALRDSMGDKGRNALIARALVRVASDQPALKDIRRLDDGGIHLDDMFERVDAHGVAAVCAATEALLAAVVDILIPLIGEDMVIRLIDPEAQRSQTSGGAQFA
jgi:hypothetical protein